jgi:mono/diheme cytochrome c family protein
MKLCTLFRPSLAAVALVVTVGSAIAESEPTALYKEYCAECHGGDRLGGQGPALLPENLKRLRKKSALKVIEKGRAQTQMPAFGETLTKEQIAALADYVYTPLKAIPRWGADQIAASHIVHMPELVEGDAKSAKPVYDADPLNVFLVVETCRSTASSRASRSMAVRNTPPTGVSFTSPRATGGSQNSTCTS